MVCIRNGSRAKGAYMRHKYRPAPTIICGGARRGAAVHRVRMSLPMASGTSPYWPQRFRRCLSTVEEPGLGKRSSSSPTFLRLYDRFEPRSLAQARPAHVVFSAALSPSGLGFGSSVRRSPHIPVPNTRRALRAMSTAAERNSGATWNT